jgi:hypothetical protein
LRSSSMRMGIWEPGARVLGRAEWKKHSDDMTCAGGSGTGSDAMAAG